MKVAIIGLADSTHEDAPWSDPDWERWGLPWDEGYWIYFDRLFEMHDLRLLEGAKCRRDDYLDRLREEVEVPLYMQRAYFETATEYPFEAVSGATGNYFNSSIGYMLAMAIYEGASHIGIWGVDMDAGDEYAYQRPNAEYLIGLARGKGIEVYIPEKSKLAKFEPDGIYFGNSPVSYQGRYGWLGDN